MVVLGEVAVSYEQGTPVINPPRGSMAPKVDCARKVTSGGVSWVRQARLKDCDGHVVYGCGHVLYGCGHVLYGCKIALLGLGSYRGRS